jgi:tetratricopeptide (TPR) repeat protein
MRADRMENNEIVLQQLQDAYHKDPTDKEVALELAQCYCDKGWYNEAIEIYTAIVNMAADDAIVLLEYGNTLFKKGDYKTARGVFMKITEIKPDKIEGWNNLGIVQIKLNDTVAAHDSFRRVLAIEPENTGALVNMGNCFFQEGHFDEACTCFEKACSVRTDLPDGWYNLGNTHIALGNLPAARLAFEKALRYCGEFPSALKNLGWIHEREGRLSDAEQCYEKALDASKADATLYVNLGNVYVRQKKFDEAKKSFLKAIRLAPHALPGWMGLRSYALTKGDINTFVRSTMAVLGRLSDEVLAQSIDVLNELHQIDKADIMIAQADRLGRKGDLLDVQRLLLYQRQPSQQQKAKELLKRLHSIASPPEAICRGLARYHLREGEFANAIAWIGRIAEPDASSLGILWRAMLAQGQVKEARKQIRQFTSQHHESCDTFFLLADIEARRGNHKRAETLLVYALDHGFNNMEEIHGNPVLHDLFESMTGKKHLEEVV